MLELLQNLIDITQESGGHNFGVSDNWHQIQVSGMGGKMLRVPSKIDGNSDKINHICKVISKCHPEELVKSVLFFFNFLVMVSESEIPKEAFAKLKFSKIKLQKI